jgi:hypothetical protein
MKVFSWTQSKRRCGVEVIVTSFKVFELLSRRFVEMYETNLQCSYPYWISDTPRMLLTTSQYFLYGHSLHAVNEIKRKISLLYWSTRIILCNDMWHLDSAFCWDFARRHWVFGARLLATVSGPILGLNIHFDPIAQLRKPIIWEL